MRIGSTWSKVVDVPTFAKKRVAVLLCLLLPALALAADTGRISQATDLRASPFSDAQSLQKLAAGAEVTVLKREGGWYKVKAGATEGYVQMWRLRFSSAGGGGAGEMVSAIQSGRASATRTTATTGIRGLSEEELANSTPDPAAVAALEQLAVPPEQARGFAQQGKLRADPGALKDD